jgi:hypothetical protein
MKHDDAPHKRWEPKPAYLSGRFHRPPRGLITKARHGEDGVPFDAQFYYDNQWYHVEGKTRIKLVDDPRDLQWLQTPNQGT